MTTCRSAAVWQTKATIMAEQADLPLAEMLFEEEGMLLPAVRDRIVILGRRAAGKTVYLSVLYERFWKRLDGLTMKAVSGNIHSDLIHVTEKLRSGVWPPATLELRHCELEIEYQDHKRRLIALDYPGEVFRQAFVDGVSQRPDAESPEADSLIEHLNAAAAVLLLVDPSSLCSDNVDAVIDDDFGITQAVAYLRASPGGTDVPVVLVYTKSDQTGRYIHHDGGLEVFTKKRLPALVRTLRRFPIYQVSAVQTTKRRDRTRIPKKNFIPVGVEKPLLECLEAIAAREEQERREAAAAERQRSVEQRIKRAEQREQQTRRTLFAVIVSMVVVAGCVIALIWASR